MQGKISLEELRKCKWNDGVNCLNGNVLCSAENCKSGIVQSSNKNELRKDIIKLLKQVEEENQINLFLEISILMGFDHYEMCKRYLELYHNDVSAREVWIDFSD